MNSNQPKSNNIYDAYRNILETPDLTNEEIDKMRPHVILIAQAICEHVWDKKFY